MPFFPHTHLLHSFFLESKIISEMSNFSYKHNLSIYTEFLYVIYDVIGTIPEILLRDITNMLAMSLLSKYLPFN